MELKPLSKEGVPHALEKAVRYRLLNEPADAESICHDVLTVDPDNQEALTTLLLSLTDQFDHRSDAVGLAREVVPRLQNDYARAYYGGIIDERQGKAQLKAGIPGSGGTVYESLRRAMVSYEKAEALSPPGNDDAILRWNACARIIDRHASVRPETHDRNELPLE